MPDLRIGLGAVLRGSTVVLVALAGPVASARPVGRWEIELGAAHPYHDAAFRAPREAPQAVADAQDGAEAAMTDGLRTLLAGLDAHPLGLALLATTAPQPEEVSQVLLSEERMLAAEVSFHRDAALAGALMAGLEVRVLEQAPGEPPVPGGWGTPERQAATAALAVLAR